jgi:hypothetical protein
MIPFIRGKVKEMPIKRRAFFAKSKKKHPPQTGA